MIFLYHRKHGRYPTFGRKQIINEAPPSVGLSGAAMRRRYRRRGVWRPHEPEEGVPMYTMQPEHGELSLGLGRKRTAEEEEYDLAELPRPSAEPNTELGDGDTANAEDLERRRSSTRTASMEARRSVDLRPPESLPPYLPPPAAAHVREQGSGTSLVRMSSRRMSSSSMRTSRGSFYAPTTARSHRVL